MSSANTGKPPAVEVPAAEPIGKFVPVAVIAGVGYVADSGNPTHAGTVRGLNLRQATPGGADCCVVLLGPVRNSAWSFAPGEVFLGASGSLVQTPPESGFMQRFGVADSATDLWVSPEPAIS